ncbi:hypothetical protein AB0395_43970 [Streptosporangium sp. NPDC051023]|uniref:hypothetical protein n=1 Tax=Streptosporangium sp. NPDC051023 TaxID=3155410 RepID=UPI00344BCE9E
MGTTKKTAARPLDWSLQPRGPVSATVQGTLALAALATIGDATGLSPIWGGAATAVGALGTVLVSAHHNHGPAALLYRLGCWMSAGAWWTYTLATTPWSQGAWASLGIGALAAGMTTSLGKATPRPATPSTATPSTALVPRRHAALAEDWMQRIKRCCGGLQVEIAEVREWPTRTGYSFLVMLPPGGATAARLKSAAEGMANDARLPQGCGIDFPPPRPGQLRGTLWMEVATVDRLSADIDHHGDYSPRSVLDGITVGEYRNGEPMTIQVREPRTIVVGTTGSGKSGTLHTITAELGRCTDNLVWHMDLNGGGIAQAWLRAWLDGEVERPAIDWATPCPEEALLMAEAEVRIAHERKTLYSRRRLEADTDLMPVDAEVPQITTILDEGAEVLAPTVRDPIERLIRERIEAIARKGREAACQVLISALRSISTTLSTDLLALMHNRIIMAGCTQKEIMYLYEQAQGVSIEDLAGPGSGFVRLAYQHTIRPWKALRVKPRRDIRPASLVISRMRPDLDRGSAAVAGQAYATRYERMRWLFSTPEERTRLPRPRPITLPGITDDRGQPIVWDPAVTHPAQGQDNPGAMVPAPSRPLVPASPATTGQRPRLTMLPGGADASTWADPMTLMRRTRPAASTASAADWPAPRRPRMLHAEQMHPLTNPTDPAPSADRPLPEIIRRALAVFDQLRADRLHSAELADALRIVTVDGDGTRPDVLALADLLRPLSVAPLATPFLRGGQRGRGYERSHLEAAAVRIRCGEVDVPPEVAAWPAA